jgi:hypothetical protein
MLLDALITTINIPTLTTLEAVCVHKQIGQRRGVLIGKHDLVYIISLVPQ